MAENRRKLQEGFRAQESRTLANFHKSFVSWVLNRESTEHWDFHRLEPYTKLYSEPGDHPNFRKNALGVKRPFSELSESSGVFSEQLSEFRN